MSESITTMLETLESIKEQQGAEEIKETDTNGTEDDGDCYECGSNNIRRKMVSKHGANRTASRHVGGQNMRVKKVCRDCDHWWF